MPHERPRRLFLKDFLPPPGHYHFARVDLWSRTYTYFHCHDFYEVFWIEDGHGFHWINGSERPLVRGSAFLIRPEDVHDFRAPEGRTLRLANVAFSQATLSALAARYKIFKKLFGQSQTKRELAPEALSGAFLAGASSDLLAGEGNRFEIDRFLLNLSAELRQAHRSTPLMPDWLEKAYQGISRPEIFSGGARAFYRLAGRSPEHVIRETRRWLGLSPSDLVNRERLRFAAQQLASTHHSIAEIAAECGVENLSHFYRIFRAEHGCTPRQFRVRNQAIVVGRRGPGPSPSGS